MTALSGKQLRDLVMFLLGSGGFIHELLLSGAERPTIMLGCLALMGLPIFLRADEKKNGDKK